MKPIGVGDDTVGTGFAKTQSAIVVECNSVLQAAAVAVEYVCFAPPGR